MAQLGMAMSAKVRGDHTDARRRFSSMGPLFQELGDRHRLNMIRSELAHIDRYEGQLDRAEAAYRETILQWKRLGHRAAVAHQLESFASIAQAREDRLKAARLYGAAEALRERIGIAMTPIERSEYDAEVARLKAGIDDKDFATAWKDGRAMTRTGGCFGARRQGEDSRIVSRLARTAAGRTRGGSSFVHDLHVVPVEGGQQALARRVPPRRVGL
jgi:hypothetical protein